jgi:hypothetical protein
MRDYDNFQPKQKKIPVISELPKPSYLLHELRQFILVILRKKTTIKF